ncbi:hypothetical protein PTKIN_Ptkin11bG0197400 [Pterospermum kingtungense]
MDQKQNQKQSLSQFMKLSQSHRKLTQLVLSVSVFSLFFSHSYWFSLVHSFTFNFHNTLPFQLFSHNIDKNCIFLLCNGLLVFLAKYSGLINSSSSKYNLSDHDQSFKSHEDVPIAMEPKAPLETDEAVKNIILMEAIQDEEPEPEAAAETETENFTMEEDEEEEEDEDQKWGWIKSVEEDEEEELQGSHDDDIFAQYFEETENYDREEEEEEEVEGNRVLSTEELNKKFDEFIRKMKEELRIEARQQLVMV